MKLHFWQDTFLQDTNSKFQFFFSIALPGMQTSQDARFYALSARFEPFSNEGNPLVIQFTVKHEQKIDCGGGYVKIFPSDLDQSNMHGDSQYYIMFGESCFSFRGSEAWPQKRERTWKDAWWIFLTSNFCIQLFKM